MEFDVSMLLLILTAVFSFFDDVLIFFIARRLGGKIGFGLKIVGFALFAILVYMVIDLLVIYFGWLNIIQYLVAHYVIESISYIPLIIGLIMIFKGLRGK